MIRCIKNFFFRAVEVIDIRIISLQGDAYFPIGISGNILINTIKIGAIDNNNLLIFALIELKIRDILGRDNGGFYKKRVDGNLELIMVCTSTIVERSDCNSPVFINGRL